MPKAATRLKPILKPSKPKRPRGRPPAKRIISRGRETLGDKIYKLRKEKSFTLDTLANLTDSSKSHIWEIENNNLPHPSADKLLKIAAALGVTINYLLDDEDKIKEADAVDQMFFRKYRKLSPDVKKKIRKIAELW
ncbi:MAG: helix-turn-helix transcriptional regulator [Pseudomonadota bacterium]